MGKVENVIKPEYVLNGDEGRGQGAAVFEMEAKGVHYL